MLRPLSFCVPVPELCPPCFWMSRPGFLCLSISSAPGYTPQLSTECYLFSSSDTAHLMSINFIACVWNLLTTWNFLTIRSPSKTVTLSKNLMMRKTLALVSHLGGFSEGWGGYKAACMEPVQLWEWEKRWHWKHEKSFALLQVVQRANTAKRHTLPEHTGRGTIIIASGCLARV